MTKAIWISIALMTLPVRGWGVECVPGQPHLMLLAGPVTHADVDAAPARAAWNPQTDTMLVTWQDATTPQLLGRHYNPDLQPVEEEPVVLVPSRPIDSVVAFNPASSRYAVVWRNQAMAVGPFNSLMGRVLDTDLELVNESIELAGAGGGFEGRVAANTGNGNFLAIGRGPLRAFEMLASGNAGNASAALPGDSAAAIAGAVAFNPMDNQYLVAWSNQGDSRLEGRILNTSITPVDAVFTVSPTLPVASSISTFWDTDNARFAVPFRAFDDPRILMRTVQPNGTVGESEIELVTDEDVSASGVLAAWQPAAPGLIMGWSAGGLYRLQLFDADGDQRSAVVTPPTPPGSTLGTISALLALPARGELVVIGSVFSGSGQSLALWRYFSGECPLVFGDRFQTPPIL